MSPTICSCPSSSGKLLLSLSTVLRARWPLYCHLLLHLLNCRGHRGPTDSECFVGRSCPILLVEFHRPALPHSSHLCPIIYSEHTKHLVSASRVGICVHTQPRVLKLQTRKVSLPNSKHPKSHVRREGRGFRKGRRKLLESQGWFTGWAQGLQWAGERGGRLRP